MKPEFIKKIQLSNKGFSFLFGMVGFFLLLILMGHALVFISPTIPSLQRSDFSPDGELPISDKLYSQEFQFNFYAFLHAKSPDDPGIKWLVEIGKLECRISFNNPKPDDYLFVYFDFFFDSYVYDSFFKTHIIQGIKFTNVSLSIHCDNITDTIKINDDSIDTILYDSYKVFKSPIIIPSNWDSSDNKSVSCMVEEISIITDKGTFHKDIFSDFNDFTMYYYYYDSIVYYESFTQSSYSGDIGNANIWIEYKLTELSTIEIVSSIFLYTLAFIFSIVFLPDYIKLTKKINFNEEKDSFKLINENDFCSYSNIIKSKSILMLVSTNMLIYLIISSFIGYIYYQRSFLVSYNLIGISFTLIAYLISIIIQILQKSRRTKIIAHNSNKFRVEQDLTMIESFYKIPTKAEIVSLLVTVLVIYLMITGKGEAVPLTI